MNTDDRYPGLGEREETGRIADWKGIICIAAS